MPRALLVHRSKFQKEYKDPKYRISQGALVLHTNGLYWYHDGTTWSPEDGYTSVGFIKLFQVAPPILNDDEFGVVAGLTDDRRMLDDTWTEANIRECLNSYLTQFSDDYSVWPDGEILLPLAKSRMLSAKRSMKRRIAVKALRENMVRDKVVVHMGRDRRRQLIG